MTSSNDFDVIVVGAGMAGASLAVGLAKDGFKVAIVERGQLLSQAAQATTLEDMDLRVVALSQSSMALLDSLGVSPLLKQGGLSDYMAMHVWDAEGTAELNFSCEEIGASSLGSLLENRVVVSALHQALLFSGVTVINGEVVELDPGAASASIILSDGSTLSASLVVGADGGHSHIRSLLDVEEHLVDNRQRAIVCNVQMSKVHNQVARQRFLSTGPLAFLPMQAMADDVCSVVWSVDTAEAEALLTLDDNTFKVALEKAFESTLGEVVSVGARASFPLVARHAQSYSAGSVVLVGDAAHVVHPLAGQGINLGFADVAALLDVLKEAKLRGLALSHPRVLAKYQRARKADTLKMIAVTQGLKSLFAVKSLSVRWLRNEGLRWVNGTAPIRKAIISTAVGS